MGEWSRGVQTFGTCNCAVDIKYVVHTGWLAVEQVIDLQTVREGELYYIHTNKKRHHKRSSQCSFTHIYVAP